MQSRGASPECTEALIGNGGIGSLLMRMHSCQEAQHVSTSLMTAVAGLTMAPCWYFILQNKKLACFKTHDSMLSGKK